jgi:prevent-host-death family protein
MQTIGVRELKARTSEVIEAVRATGQPYQVTRRGVPVAAIVPLPGAIPPDEAESIAHDLAVWAELDALAEEIGRRWPTGVSAVAALAESRR